MRATRLRSRSSCAARTAAAYSSRGSTRRATPPGKAPACPPPRRATRLATASGRGPDAVKPRGALALLLLAAVGCAAPAPAAAPTASATRTGEATMPHAMALLLAQRDGVPRDDLAFAFMGFPEMNVALANGSVDVAGSTEPFVTIGEQNGTVRRWLSYNEITPGVPIGTVIYGDALLVRDRDAGDRFLQAWLRGARDYDDAITTGRDLEEVQTVLTARMPADTFGLLLRHNTLLYVPPEATLDPRPLA